MVLGLSFYTLNNAYGSVSRMATIETQLENPFAYLFNLEYNVNMLTNIANKLSGAADATEEETRNPLPDDLLDASGAELSYRVTCCFMQPSFTATARSRVPLAH